MKSLHHTSVLGLMLAVGFSLASGVIAPAQTETQTASDQPDSTVAVVANAQHLPLVSADQVPPIGNYWTVEAAAPFTMPPLPWAPLDPSLPIYLMAEGQFLVDATHGLVSPLQSGPNALMSQSEAALWFRPRLMLC